MRDLPPGYGLWWLADQTELTTPEGKRFLYSPEATFSKIVADAWQHRAMQNPCDCECWICEERGVA